MQLEQAVVLEVKFLNCKMTGNGKSSPDALGLPSISYASGPGLAGNRDLLQPVCLSLP